MKIVRIRPATGRDVDIFARMHARNWRRPIDFVTVLLHTPTTSTLLDNVHVVPDRQRRGVGQRLMAEAAQWTREDLASRLSVEPTAR